MIKKLNISLVFIALGLAAFSQQNGTGTVMVANDYRDSTSNAIAIKWFDEKVFYEDGFNLYRREGNGPWQKLNETPIKVAESVPSGMPGIDEQATSFLQLINETSYRKFQEGIMPAFVAIFGIVNPAFAELVGFLRYDEDTKEGRQYQYRVMSVDGKKENLVGISRVIQPGDFVPQNPPIGVQTQRRAGAVDLNWTPEVTRYYGVYVYRKTEGQAVFKRINNLPYALQRIKNQQGELEYPDVFFTDTTAVDSISYIYKLSALDFFGQEGPQSAEISTTSVDFEAPPAPINLKAEADTLKVNLTWDIVPSGDLVGFNIYRYADPDETPQKLTSVPIARRESSFLDQLDQPGGYYYAVAAVDEAGNDNATRLFIEVRDIVAPDAPLGLIAESDTGKVNLRWEANEEADLAGYVVYRSLADENNADNSFVVVTPEILTSNQYEDKLPKNARNKFVYAVGAVDTSYNYSVRSDIATIQLPDVTPPLAPVITQIEVQEGLLIRWIGSAADDLKGYQLYRSDETSPTEFERITQSITADQTSFLDQNVTNDIKYNYRLTAIDQSNNLSDSSNIYTKRMVRPEENRITLELFEVTYEADTQLTQLSWNDVQSDELRGYIVYRGVDGNTPRPITGFEANSEYTDDDLPKKGEIVYQVRAYGSKGLLASSEKKLIQVITNEN